MEPKKDETPTLATFEGRTVQSARVEDEVLFVEFTDGTSLIVSTSGYGDAIEVSQGTRTVRRIV